MLLLTCDCGIQIFTDKQQNHWKIFKTGKILWFKVMTAEILR